MTPELNKIIAAAVDTIRDNSTLLTELDQAIGDGDHGINMKRGFDAVAEAATELAALAPGAALQKLGMTLVMKVGGASGPLYGSFLSVWAKRCRNNPLWPMLQTHSAKASRPSKNAAKPMSAPRPCSTCWYRSMNS
jgi:hypothetical protein